MIGHDGQPEQMVGVYLTTDDEQFANAVAARLNASGRKAMVRSVQEMSLADDPLTPRTYNRFAVIAERLA